MLDYALPALFTVFIWWFSTGAIIYLNGRPRHTFRWTFLGATALLGAALYGLSISAWNTTPAGAYLAFSAGILIWGWHEIGFLMGFVTGPRCEPCPSDCTGWRRVGLAILTILYHEIAILVTALAILALTWGAPNQTGVWAFMILWVMRLSAKLNVFLGVPNFTDDFLPEHLRYLRSYFAKRSVSVLFPISVSTSTIAAALLVHVAWVSPLGGYGVPGAILLATLLALAILEHWFLVLPLRDAALWRWWLAARDPERPRWRSRRITRRLDSNILTLPKKNDRLPATFHPKVSQKTTAGICPTPASSTSGT